jgi:hypothetical protein
MIQPYELRRHPEEPQWLAEVTAGFDVLDPDELGHCLVCHTLGDCAFPPQPERLGYCLALGAAAALTKSIQVRDLRRDLARMTIPERSMLAAYTELLQSLPVCPDSLKLQPDTVSALLVLFRPHPTGSGNGGEESRFIQLCHSKGYWPSKVGSEPVQLRPEFRQVDVSFPPIVWNDIERIARWARLLTSAC